MSLERRPPEAPVPRDGRATAARGGRPVAPTPCGGVARAEAAHFLEALDVPVEAPLPPPPPSRLLLRDDTLATASASALVLANLSSRLLLRSSHGADDQSLPPPVAESRKPNKLTTETTAPSLAQATPVPSHLEVLHGEGRDLHLHPVERLLRTRSTETSLCTEGKAALVHVNGDRGRRIFGVTDVDGMGRAW